MAAQSKLFLCALICLNFFCACNGKLAQYDKIIIHTSAPLNSKIHITDIPFNNEKEFFSDSATIINNKDSLVFFVPNQLQRLYKIYVQGLHLQIVLINDAPVITINANYFSNQYSIKGSKASLSLKNFTEKQMSLGKDLSILKKYADSLKKVNNTSSSGQRLDSAINAKVQYFYQQYINYTDTVKSPAAFMKVYNNIDFGSNYKASKQSILKAAARFPSYKPLQDYKKEVLETVKIYESEYNIGDKLPAITLPDVDGNIFSTKSLNSIYYLIDFWSTFCQQCIVFKEQEKNIAKKLHSNRLAIVSVAIDDNKDAWKNIVIYNKYNWKQLIDEQMWQGPSVRTLLFDSIPFNFLVDPKGRIIKKAITATSLDKVIDSLKLH